MKIKDPSIAFLLYDSRSGSTFLSSQLDAYTDIGVTVESNLMRTLLLKKEAIHGAKTHEELYNILSHDARFKNLNLDPSSLSSVLPASEPLSIQTILKTTLAAYFDRSKPEAKTWLVKDATNGNLINKIARELPAAKFVHIIRDGRAVLNSKLCTTRPYGKGEKMARDPITTAKQWVRLIRNIDSFSSKHPGRVLTVRYENLLIDKETEIGHIRTFLGLTDHIKHDQRSYFERIPSLEKAVHTGVKGEAIHSRIDGWKTELEKGNIMVFDYFACDTLREKGYSCANSDRRSPFLSLDFLLAYCKSFLLRIKDWPLMIVNFRKTKRIIENKMMRKTG